VFKCDLTWSQRIILYTLCLPSQAEGGWVPRNAWPFQISHTPPTHSSVGSNPLVNFLFTFIFMDHQELARRQARNPRLILVQLLIEALRTGTLTREDLALFQDVACAVITLCGVGMVNECLLELFCMLWCCRLGCVVHA